MSQPSPLGWIDISPVITERIGVFPGDVPFARDVSYDFVKGDHLLLSSIRSTLHLGAHADGPNHYSASGEGIGERDLSIYFGPCLVVHTTAKRGMCIGRQHLAETWVKALTQAFPVSRILFRTESFPDPDNWNHDFCSIEPELIEDLARAGVRLVGIDTPSIDPENSKSLSAHQVVAKHDLAILEGLVLRDVSEGYYTLMALPLRLIGADASPVRAVLFRDAHLFDT